jgi:DNA polymerase I
LDVTRLLFDTESNGFVSNSTKLHCIATIDIDTGERSSYRPSELAQGLYKLASADELIGHNIVRHDIPLLQKLHKFHPKAGCKVSDTLVMARVIYPNVKKTDFDLTEKGAMPKEYLGKHSMAAWGYRLGLHKGDYAQVRRAQALAQGITDEKAITEYVWGEWNADMHEYMVLDCEVNLALLEKLRPESYPQAPLDLEHRVAVVCDAIQDAGVPFDLGAAGHLQAELMGRKHELEERLKKEFGFWFQPVSPDPLKALFTPKRPNKDAGYWGDYEVITDLDGHQVGKTFKGYPCTKLKLVEFNPGSRDHIARKLMERGWQPSKFTDGGKPQLDEETIEAVVALYPEMAGIGELLMVEKRLSQLIGSKQSLMDNVEDGRIHGSINPMGTITSRAAHFKPNLGQVPSAKKPYGKDFRKLFVPGKPGWVIVGADMEALELRGLAHYLSYYDGGAYGKVVLEGDPHWINVLAMGLAPPGTERDKHNKLHTIVREDGSKRFVYASVYGAGDEMCGSIIYETLMNARANVEGGEALYNEFFQDPVYCDQLKRVGGRIRRSFADKITGFSKLQRDIAKRVHDLGYVSGLDKRKTPIRAAHSALNFLIQGAGAILCKRWLADAFAEACQTFKLGEDFQFVLWVHDEIQVICREEIAERIGYILVKNAQAAGIPYGFKLPLDSNYSIGASWADTH